jgi:hypothetical protein
VRRDSAFIFTGAAEKPDPRRLPASTSVLKKTTTETIAPIVIRLVLNMIFSFSLRHDIVRAL